MLLYYRAMKRLLICFIAALLSFTIGSAKPAMLEGPTILVKEWQKQRQPLMYSCVMTETVIPKPTDLAAPLQSEKQDVLLSNKGQARTKLPKRRQTSIP